ncbi:MAG: hypothetical protein K1X53_03290 [Candidatus Sumerlaeaceae bacterium]|nr:hypothetical protein [Candidatus Sumerlaeaceae bacterium]
MKTPAPLRSQTRVYRLLWIAAAVVAASPAFSEETTPTAVTTATVVTATAAETSATPAAERPLETQLSPCEPLPKGQLSDEDLARLVPDNSPGRVRVRWRTETQEDNYGFNIYRGRHADGPYVKVNKSIIPGEGTTNIPKDYCFAESPLPRGETFYYYIEHVTNKGVAETIEGTKGTKVTVRTVPEERDWLRKKAAESDVPTTTPLVKSTETTAPPTKRGKGASPTAQVKPVAVPLGSAQSDPLN